VGKDGIGDRRKETFFRLQDEMNPINAIPVRFILSSRLAGQKMNVDMTNTVFYDFFAVRTNRRKS